MRLYNLPRWQKKTIARAMLVITVAMYVLFCGSALAAAAIVFAGGAGG